MTARFWWWVIPAVLVAAGAWRTLAEWLCRDYAPQFAGVRVAGKRGHGLDCDVGVV